MSDEGSVEIDNDELVSAVRIGDIPRITRYAIAPTFSTRLCSSALFSLFSARPFYGRLVAEGCDVGYVDDYERTSLLWAVDGGDEKVCCVFSFHESKVFFVIRGQVVECLFKLSADVSCTTPAGSTVLHLVLRISFTTCLRPSCLRS